MARQNPEDIEIEVLAEEEEEDEASWSVSYQTNTFPADFTLEVLKVGSVEFQVGCRA